MSERIKKIRDSMRIEEIRKSPTWKLGWNINISKAIFMDLMEKLDGYGIPEEEVDDILSIALHAALNEGKQR